MKIIKCNNGIENTRCYKIEGHFIDKQKPINKLPAFIMELKKNGYIFLFRIYKVDGMDNLENICDYLSDNQGDYIYSPPRIIKKILGLIPRYSVATIHCLSENENILKFLLDKFWYGCDTIDICLVKKDVANKVREMLVAKIGQDIEKMSSDDLLALLNATECLILKIWDGQSLKLLTTKIADNEIQNYVTQSGKPDRRIRI